MENLGFYLCKVWWRILDFICVRLGGEYGKVLMSVFQITDLESTPSCACHSLSIEPHVLV